MNKFERDPKLNCVKVSRFFSELGRWVGEWIHESALTENF